MNDVEQNSPDQDVAVHTREPLQIAQLKPIIEAALLASSHPMTVQQLGELFGDDDDVGREKIARTLEALAEDCNGRGIELREVASGFRYQVRQDVHPWLSRLWTERPSRYSRALLETLALIAYRQPITRPEIEQIRGVVVSSNIIKTMEERDWIRVVGHRDVPGKPALFGTTRAFLDYFNLKSLDELPPLSEIRDMEDPQLRFEAEPLPARVVKDLPIDPEAEAEIDHDAVSEGTKESAASAADRDSNSTDEAETTSGENPIDLDIGGPPDTDRLTQDTSSPDTTADETPPEPSNSPAESDMTPSSGSAAPEAPDTDIHTADEAANEVAADDGATEKHS